MRWAWGVLLAAGCSRGAPPPAPVEMFVVGHDVSPAAAPHTPRPFPARSMVEDKETYWEIPAEHEDALRAFAAELSVPEGRRVLVAPSRQGFSRTWVVDATPAVAGSCVQSMEKGDTETTFELSAPCVGKLSATTEVLVTVGGKAIAAPQVGVASGSKVVLETEPAPARN